LASVPNGHRAVAGRWAGNGLVGLRCRRRPIPVSVLLVWRPWRRPSPRARPLGHGCRRGEMGDGAYPSGPYPLARPPHLLGRRGSQAERIRRDLDAGSAGAPSHSQSTSRRAARVGTPGAVAIPSPRHGRSADVSASRAEFLSSSPPYPASAPDGATSSSCLPSQGAEGCPGVELLA
jgi:hypothetical protein